MTFDKAATDIARWALSFIGKAEVLVDLERAEARARIDALAASAYMLATIAGPCLAEGRWSEYRALQAAQWALHTNATPGTLHACINHLKGGCATQSQSWWTWYDMVEEQKQYAQLEAIRSRIPTICE